MNDVSKTIDEYLEKLPDWQRKNLTEFRALLHQTNDSITEDWKWNVPVFLVNGKMLFAMSAFKAHTKYNFIGNGAQLDDPNGLFNNGLESKKSRGIDLKEGESIDTSALSALVADAIRQA